MKCFITGNTIIMCIINLIKSISKRRINRLIKKTSDGVEYIWLRHHSDTLIIVFSGIGNARFNYLRTLKDCKCDQLYIRDCWAGGVSYYWYEKKSNHPETYTDNLIASILKEKRYNEIVTVGSSKGGTAAIYYGLKIKANLIYAGACQYKVGDYLSRHQFIEHPEQWNAVVGDDITDEWVNILDNKVSDVIKQNRGCPTKIKLLYSVKEHTYDDHIKPLLNQIEACGIQHEDQVEEFPEHSMIGDYFKRALYQYFIEGNR